MPTVVFALVLSAIALIVSDVRGVQITDLRVPSAVKNASGVPAILDCEYSLRPDEVRPDSGLVVKWFFNSEPDPVYQWIPKQKPQELGILRGRLKLDYKASQHNATMHRALYIMNPTTELAGDYKCFVSTFQDEDFMIKKMIVYTPEKKLEVIQTKAGPDTVNVTCRALGVYPEPKLSLFKDPDRKHREPLEGVYEESELRDGAYDVTVRTVLDSTSSSIDCELRIPGTPYVKTKTVRYLPGSVESLSSVSRGMKEATKPLLILMLSLLPMIWYNQMNPVSS